MIHKQRFCAPWVDILDPIRSWPTMQEDFVHLQPNMLSRGTANNNLVSRATTYEEAGNPSKRLFDSDISSSVYDNLDQTISGFVYSHVTSFFILSTTLLLALIFWPTDARWPSPHNPLVFRWLLFISLCFGGYLCARLVETLILTIVKRVAIRFQISTLLLVQGALRSVLGTSLLLVMLLLTKESWEDWYFEGILEITDDIEKIIQTLLIICFVMVTRNIVNAYIIWKLDLELHVKRLSTQDKEDWAIECLCSGDSRAFSSRSPMEDAFFSPTRKRKKLTQQLLARNDRLSSFENRAKVKEFADKLFRHIDCFKSGSITLNDFDDYFESDDAIYAFLLFKQGSSTTKIDSMVDIPEPYTIDLGVFIDSVVRMYNARLSSFTELQSSSSASSMMTGAVTSFSWFVIPFIVAGMCGIDVNTILISTTSLFISFSFAFRQSISRMVESAYFLFITKPFNVGDRIQSGIPSMTRDVYIVTAIDLMTTTAKTPTNKLVMLPNYALASQNLINYNRLPNAIIVIDLDISSKTPASTLAEFHANLKNFLKSNRDKWTPSKCSLVKGEIVNANQLTFTMRVQSQFSWQEGRKLMAARSQLMDHIKESFMLLNISYTQAPLRVELYQLDDFQIN